MSIQEKLNSLKPYVKAMRFHQDFPVIDAVFKKGWKVPKGELIKFGKDEKSGLYTFLCENKNSGFDELLEYIEQIITFNVDLEKKRELFKVKSKELQKIFLSSENNYDDLINLKFVMTPKENNKEEEEEEELTLFDGVVNDDEIIKKEVINIEEKKESIVKSENKREEMKVIEKEELPPLAETEQPKYEI